METKKELQKKVEELYGKATLLEGDKLLRFIKAWHGEEFLWDMFVQSYNSFLVNEGEKETIVQLESALEQAK